MPVCGRQHLNCYSKEDWSWGIEGITRYGAVALRRALRSKRSSFYYKYEKYYTHIDSFNATVSQSCDNIDYGNNADYYKALSNVPNEKIDNTNLIKLEMIDKNIAKERLQLIQGKLFDNQIQINKLMENQIIDVLVENKIEKQNKYFGRNNYITPVIFDGSDNQIGKIIKVKIKTSNQNTLFGSATKNMKAAWIE